MSKTIFVAGIHGVGKTYLCESIPHLNLHFASASSIIKTELTDLNWDQNKVVNGADRNQVALMLGLEKIRKANPNTDILLDGHFILRTPEGFLAIDHSVFYSLNLDAILLVEDSPDKIAERISTRDSVDAPTDLEEFLRLENDQANDFCLKNNKPFFIVKSGDKKGFEIIVKNLINAGVV